MRVSDFKLVNPKDERERLLATLEGFNRTAHDFDRERPLHEILEERARAVPSAIAVRGDGVSLTYGELLDLSGRIASWAATLPPRSARIAGVLMENTPDMVAAALGILRAGAVYLPINPDLPLDRIAGMLNDTGAQILLTERKFAREADRLQYECSALTHLVCLDSASFRDEEEQASELSRLDIWEYVGEEATDAISGGGWKNSYNGLHLSPEIMQEYANNAYLKLSPFLPNSRVLEIGCSTGLTMFRLAQECSLYYGIDFSKTILEKTKAEVERHGIGNITLECLAAHEVDRIRERDFDLVILNSVAQNFNGHNYLRQVLLKAARLLKPEGRIFLGDLMDQDRKQALIDSLVQFQRDNSGKGFSTKTDWSAELFLSRGWIEDMCLDFPGVATACHTEKICTIPNELTDFRFDSLITIHRDEVSPGWSDKRFRYQVSRPDLDAYPPDPLPSQISAEAPAYIIYTSGTTGKPKGVVVSHRSIHNYVQWAARYYFPECGGNMALFTSPAFDLTLTSIFVPLYLGRSIHAFRNRDIDQLLEEVFAAPVDSIKLTPSHISILENCSLQPASIQVAIVGGEDLTVEQVRILHHCAPGVRIYNEYGPTEATIGCTACLVEEPGIHIGKPVDNTEVWILGGGGELRPIGTAGELCVAGDGLANGYFGDTELTTRKFVPHPVRAGQRIYRTGDQARWMPDGNLMLLGRIDTQVKIRGNRIELGEIESQLRMLAGVRDAAVLARADTRGEKALCAYIIPDSGLDLDVQALRAGLARVFPDYLIPSYFAALKEFPLSLNGKLDRKRLPEPEAMAQERAADYQAPSTETEKALADIWREVLGVSRIGVNDNFFELGGHSLKATQVVSRVHRTLQAALELRQVFRRPVLRDMAVAIDRARRFQFDAIDPLPPAADYELSHAQQRLWILQQIEPDSIAYNIHDGIGIQGELDVATLRSAFEALVSRHESLRTIIVSTPGGPRQRVLDDIGFEVAFEDLERASDPAAQAMRIAVAEASAPFDLGRGPLLRVRLLRLGAGIHRLLLTMHHVVSDGWSAGVMVRELMHFYGSCCDGTLPSLPALRIQYKDYAAWQNRLLTDAEVHARFWHQRLAGPLPAPDLPTDFPRPVQQSFAGDSVRFRVPDGLAQALARLAERERVSLFMILNAGLKALIYRLTGAEDVILGVPVSGRTHIDLENQIGFFANTLALRDQIRPYEGFRDLLSRIRRTTTEAFEHQVYPFDRLVNELALDRDTSRSPLFDVMLVLHNNEQPKIAMEGLRVEPLATELPISRFDLTFHFFELEGGIAVTVEYSTALFQEERIHRFWASLARLLEDATTNLSQPIAEVDILPDGEMKVVTADFNRTEAPWESVLAMFRSQVLRRPEQPAVVCGDHSLTYAVLDQRSSELASRLRSYTRGNDVVAMMLDRSERNLIALVACLKAGCAYLAVDPSYPQHRVATILENSRASVVVVDDGRPEKLGGYGGAVVGFADPMPGEELPCDPREGRIAYVVYTSGSTGAPKGVAGTAQCLGNLISWQRRIIGDGLRSAQYAALGFDVSVQEMLYAVCSGGTLYVAGDEERFDPARLRQFLERNEIELVTMPYSGLNLLFGTQFGLERILSLKHLITSGEQLRITPELRLFLNRRPDVRLHNQYGPSETHVVTAYTLPSGGGDVGKLPPIGKPIANTRCYILDRRKEPVPIGIAGELFLAGANLAEGYLHDPALTAARFIDDPFRPGQRMYQTGDLCRWRFDGEIEFLGRLDDQVKIRGYRVEPGEIEAALQSLPEVRAVCVTPWKTPAGQMELAAYYTAAAPLEEAVLREHLSCRLPPYMVPARFINLAAMPLTSTGKVNRRALPCPASTPAGVGLRPREPMSASAQRVAKAFVEVLERDAVDLDDDFFHLGGHSLRAVQLAARLQWDFSMEVPLITVFQRSTVRRLSEWIDGLREYRQQHDEKNYAELNASTGPPVFAMPPLLGYAVAFRRLAALLPSHRVYGFDFLTGPGLLEGYAAAIDRLHPVGNITLFGYSGGGNLAFELAKHLESARRTVTLILLDSFRLESTSQQTEEQLQRSVQLNLEYFDRYLEEDRETRVFVQNETVRAILVKKMSSYLRYLNTIDNRGMIRGDIYLVESNEYCGDPRRADWETATGGSFVKYSGHGAHVEMILKEYVNQNAAILNGILTREKLP